MKRVLVLLFPVIFIMIMNGCSKNGDNSPLGPEIQGTPDGMYKSDGIVSWISPNTSVTWNFSGEKLLWDVTYYKKGTPESQAAFDYESLLNFNFKTDNSFLVINALDVNKYVLNETLYFHYKLEGNKLTLSPGRIYTGNSNNLTGTFWEFKVSPEVNAPSVKYFYKDDKTGYYITGAQDTVVFTYNVDGNAISHEYNYYGRKISYRETFEIKDNKLYFYDRQGEARSEFEYENLGALTLFKSSASDETKDYFPLVKGNRWWFNYSFSPQGGYGFPYTSGTLSWEIISASEPDANKTVKYNVRETFEGYKIPSYMSKDTVFIGPDTAYFDITEDAFHSLTINSKLTALGQVTIKRYYSESTPDPLMVTTSNYTSHEITLRRNSGPEKWFIGMASNGDQSGMLKTVNKVLAVK